MDMGEKEEERTQWHGGRMDQIICFDFTRERFGPLLPLPSSFTDRRYVYASLSCVKEEKIAALFQHHDKYDTEFEIWITTKIEVEMVSWRKFLRMDTAPKIGFPDTFFIDEEKKVFMGCGTHYDSDNYGRIFIHIIGEARYLRKLDPGVPADENCRLDVCSYVPSLSQIKKPARGKRIEQSSLEKRRFDQNMLRLAVIEKLMRKQNRYW